MNYPRRYSSFCAGSVIQQRPGLRRNGPRGLRESRHGEEMITGRFKFENKQLVIEVPTIIRVPIMMEAVVHHSQLDNIKLTRCESRVLKSVLAGLANKEIANDIGVSVSAIKSHVSSLLKKFKAGDRLILMALFSGTSSDLSANVS
jgi:DNA-binding CsgD family transcriptional regulator